MNCRATRTWARMRRDDPAATGENAAFRAHLAGCARCAAYASDMDTLSGMVVTAPLDEPSPSFDWRLKLRISKLERDGVGPPLFDSTEPAHRRPQLEFWGATAAAAMVVVAVGLATLRQETTAVPTPANRPIASNVPIDAGAQVRPVASGRAVGPQAPLSYSSFFIEEPVTVATPPDSVVPATPR